MGKRTSGKRTKSGRLSRSKQAKLERGIGERNPAPDHILLRRERFRHFRGDASVGFEMTCAGRLMLVGAFDGLEVSAETILNALQTYSDAYWGHWGGGPRVAAYERHDKGHDSVWEDPAGAWFDETDGYLRNAGHAARSAVHDVSVNRHWFPDEDVDWASRIINTRIVQKRKALVDAKRPVPDGLTVIGELACDSDWAMLDLLRSGAMALVSRGRRMAA